MPLVEECGRCCRCDEEVEVRCADGAVRGCKVQTCYGPQYIRFAGIPYAKPPTGPLRFLPPVPLGGWEGTLDATAIKQNCWSYDDVDDVAVGTEDCLHNTIHTPNVRAEEAMPVMVFVGGYGFYYDSYKMCGSGWFTDRRVVVVHVSYRLGPFGFLSIQEATAPGNCGLKDVVAALRWIQRNISAFGGDPGNVTLFGSMSGASVVHYMVLSPLAVGLFHKAILQTGSALHHWAFSYHPIDCTRKLAEEINVDTKDMTEAVEQLRTMSAEEIMEAFRKIKRRGNKKHAFYTFFKPCAEVAFEGQPAFLTTYPYYLLKSGRYNEVPLIIGSNRHEGKALMYFMKPSMTAMFDKLNMNLSTLVPSELGFDESSHGSKNLLQRLLQFYAGGQKFTEENSEDFFNFITDFYFTYYTNKCAKTHAKNAVYHPNNPPIYYYILEAASEWNKPHFCDTMKQSPSLGTDISFLFQMFSCVYYGVGGEPQRIRQKMQKLWTNFARYGNPTPSENDDELQVTWDPITDPTRLNYLSIGSDLTKGCNPFNERMSFWDSILDETCTSRIAAFFDIIADETRMNWLIHPSKG